MTVRLSMWVENTNIKECALKASTYYILFALNVVQNPTNIINMTNPLRDNIVSCMGKWTSESKRSLTCRLALFDVTEKNVKDQNEIVKDIVQTIQEIIDNLQMSKEFHLEQAERATRQKIQLNSLERELRGWNVFGWAKKMQRICWGGTKFTISIPDTNS